jgi:hypothetical protein
MRLLLIGVVALFMTGLLMFLYYNWDTEVTIVVLGTTHPDVPVFLLVFLTSLASVLFVGIIAIAEGANIRLANRRLRREIQQLETEINYLRTQPPRDSRYEPDAVRGEGAGEREPRAAAREAPAQTPPSAPVYGTGTEDDWTTDDDDIYSGGRAV